MTTPYYLRLAPSAQRQIAALSAKQQAAIFKVLEALAINPRPPGVKKIDGLMGLYAESVNDLRLLYKVEEQEVLLLVVK